MAVKIGFTLNESKYSVDSYNSLLTSIVWFYLHSIDKYFTERSRHPLNGWMVISFDPWYIDLGIQIKLGTETFQMILGHFHPTIHGVFERGQPSEKSITNLKFTFFAIFKLFKNGINVSLPLFLRLCFCDEVEVLQFRVSRWQGSRHVRRNELKSVPFTPTQAASRLHSVTVQAKWGWNTKNY